MLLSLAQIQFSKPQRDLEAVINILRSSSGLRLKPGIASLLVLLYEQQGDIKSAVDIFDQCAAAYANQKVALLFTSSFLILTLRLHFLPLQLTEKQTQDYIAILKASGEFKMKHGLYEEAAKSYTTLVQLNKNDVESLYSTNHYQTVPILVQL